MDFTPVIIGGDIGSYALARELFEAYQVHSVVVSPAPAPVVSKSVFCKVIAGHSTRSTEELATLFHEIEREHPGKLLILTNSDLYAELLSALKEAAPSNWIIPFADVDVVKRVSDKVQFNQICAELDIPYPRSEIVSFPHQGPVEATQIAFPVVAKTASGAAYANVSFAGKKKIYFIESQTELDALWENLQSAGYEGDFLVQELIYGDDTAMRSITAYVDSAGAVTMIGSARVLLEDHLPTMIGNPVAMITEEFPELWQDAKRFLKATNYRGFANFDVKVDARTGRAVFFEVNTRIGRNSYYLAAGGMNPMRPLVEDLVRGRRLAPKQLTNEILYSLVPIPLLLRYVADPQLRTRIKKLVRNRKVFDPTLSPVERSLSRRLTLALQKLNQYRKFAKHYKKATETSF